MTAKNSTTLRRINVDVGKSFARSAMQGQSASIYYCRWEVVSFCNSVEEDKAAHCDFVIFDTFLFSADGQDTWTVALGDQG